MVMLDQSLAFGRTPDGLVAEIKVDDNGYVLLAPAALGLAWNRVEAALPEGWVLRTLDRSVVMDHWVASAENENTGPTSDGLPRLLRQHGYGRTPTAALLDLAEKLEAIK